MKGVIPEEGENWKDGQKEGAEYAKGERHKWGKR